MAKKVDDFLTHEALHTAHICICMVDEHLATHPAITDNPEWEALAQAAMKNLFDLYQAIGAKHL